MAWKIHPSSSTQTAMRHARLQKLRGGLDFFNMEKP
jgi:hypothetical protein